MEEKKLTLSDLGVSLPQPQQENTEGYKTTIIRPDQVGGLTEEKSDIGEIADYQEVVAPEKIAETFYMDIIDSGIERVKEDLLVNVINPVKDRIITARLEAEADGLSDIPADNLTTITPDIPVQTQLRRNIKGEDVNLELLDNKSRFNIDDEDLKDLIDNDVEDDDQLLDDSKDEETDRQKASFERYQQKIKEVIKPIKKGINIKEFRISTSPVSITNALKKAVVVSKSAQWPLLNTGRLITLSGLSGDEIVNMNPDNYDSDFQAARAQYSILYSHDIGPNKPSYEVWLKSICTYDIDELMFAAYKATFGDSNYVTYPCDVCKDVDLREAIIEYMVKYSSDSHKEKFLKLLNEGNDTHPSLLEAKLVPVSDEYAIAFKAPSIYASVFETSALTPEFTKKYADILSILAFIDNIYVIDTDNHVFVPIDCNPDRDNVTKTVRRKVVAYYNLIQKLTPDQYTLIGVEIAKIGNNARKNNITYQIPTADCNGIDKKTKTKCSHIFPDQPMSPLDMLFTRHQLAAIGNYSKEEE